MMTTTELRVLPEEQTVFLQNGYRAAIRFDMIYKRWFYDLYLGEQLVYAGMALNTDTSPLLNISLISLGLVDTSNDKEEYEPYNELGSRLALLEIAE